MEKAGTSSKSSTPPTTFVQTDATTFRELVQRLTAGTFDAASPAALPPPRVAGSKRPTGKLHERRQYVVRAKLDITKPTFQFKPGQPVGPALRSPPAFLNLASPPSGNFSRLSIFDREMSESAPESGKDDEERAINEKGFYLHPSPVYRRGSSEPALLNLFPLSP